MKTFQNLLLAGAGLGLAALLLICSPSTAAGVRRGLSICAGTVIPSLFPFMVFSCFLSRSRLSQALSRIFSPITKYLFRLPPQTGTILLMSFIGGYPVGAKLISSSVKRGALPVKLGERMLCFCVNAGPSFLISAVGLSMFGSRQLGLCLLGAHCLSSVLIAFLTGIFSRDSQLGEIELTPEPMLSAFVNAVLDAADSILKMCGFIVFFSAVSQILQDMSLFFLSQIQTEGQNGALAQALFSGILEVTAGCLQASSCQRPAALLLTAFLVSFSGISIIFQVSSCFAGQSFSLIPFYLSRFVHGALTVLLFSCLYHWSAPVFFSEGSAPVPVYHSNSFLLTFSLLAMCSLLLSVSSKTFSCKKG